MSILYEKKIQKTITGQNGLGHTHEGYRRKEGVRGIRAKGASLAVADWTLADSDFLPRAGGRVAS